MSLHPSLKVDTAGAQQRSVLTRIERIKDLMKKDLLKTFPTQTYTEKWTAVHFFIFLKVLTKQLRSHRQKLMQAEIES